MEVTPEKILKEINKNIETPISFGKPPDRTMENTDIRAVFFKLCRELTDLGYSKIGSYFKRDHSTVIHAEKKIFPVLEFNNKQVYYAYVQAKYNLLNNIKNDSVSKFNEFTKSHDSINIDCYAETKRIQIELDFIKKRIGIPVNN